MQREDYSQLDKYGRPYPNYKNHPCPVLACDNVVIKEGKNSGEFDVLMCTRGKDPYKGYYVLPGGHVDYNEDPAKGAVRELKEETNMDALSCELLTVRGDPERDPRKHVVSIVYLVKVANDQEPKGGDDADDARFYNLKELLTQKEKIGFDHYGILEEAAKKLNIL